MKRLLFLLILPILLVTCKKETGINTEKNDIVSNEIKDIVYSTADGTDLLLDLYLPTTEEPAPIIVFIHGGGFTSGSRTKLFFNPVIVNKRGYAFISIDYRLAPQYTFPTQINDCKESIRWIREHGAQYNLDTSRIGVWGESAGAYLSTFLGVTGDVAALGEFFDRSDSNYRVGAVCHFYGPTDFSQLDSLNIPGGYPHNNKKSPESLFIGGAIEEFPDEVQIANPIQYIDKNDPPFLIIHGCKDTYVPYTQSV